MSAATISQCLFCLGRLAYINGDKITILDLVATGETGEKNEVVLPPEASLAAYTHFIKSKTNVLHIVSNNGNHFALDDEKYTIKRGPNVGPSNTFTRAGNYYVDFDKNDAIEMREDDRLVAESLPATFDELCVSNKGLYYVAANNVWLKGKNQPLVSGDVVVDSTTNRLTVMVMESGMHVVQLASRSGDVRHEENVLLDKSCGDDVRYVNIDAQGDFVLTLMDHDRVVIRELFSEPKRLAVIYDKSITTGRGNVLLFPPSKKQIAAWIQKITALLAITPLLPELSRLVAMLML